MATLICRNEIGRPGAKNVAMNLDPSTQPAIDSVGQKRPCLSTLLAVFIVLAGIVVLVAILMAYGLIGLF